MLQGGDHYPVSRSECFPPQVVQTIDTIDVTFVSVEEVVRSLHGAAHYTPVLTRCQLHALAGARVFLTCENFQRAGAFKFRGGIPRDRPVDVLEAVSCVCDGLVRES